MQNHRKRHWSRFSHPASISHEAPSRDCHRIEPPLRLISVAAVSRLLLLRLWRTRRAGVCATELQSFAHVFRSKIITLQSTFDYFYSV